MQEPVFNLKFLNMAWVTTCAIFFLYSPLRASSYAEGLIDQAVRNNLHKKASWKKILYYSNTWFGDDIGIIDSETFYLAKDGKENPKAELSATIAAFFSPINPNKPIGHHPLCAYPARFRWLGRHLTIDQSKLPEVPCTKLKKWIGNNRFARLSLVFSSYYPDNPASMFGHTFLRLHRSKKEGMSADLLDQSINFSAFPDTSNAILYTLKGVLGQFPGKYQLTPYFMKVQEYNNAERRDLWQYELDFSPEEIEFLLFCLWEIGSHHVDYFYFDDNCSAVILTLLEAVKPQLNLKRSIKAWVIPADTLRAVANSPGLVRSISIEPSVLTKFLVRYNDLSRKQRAVVDQLFSKKIKVSQLSKQPSAASAADQTRILDTLLELIDFDDRVAGSSLGEKHTSLRQEVLISRSKLKLKPKQINYNSPSKQPHLGHESSQIGLGVGSYETSDEFLDLVWRPALHELLALDEGYSENLEIGFFHTNLRYQPEQKTLYLKEYSLIRIWSLPTTPWVIKQPAWTLDIGMESVEKNCSHAQSVCQRYFINTGTGYTEDFFSKSIVLYLLLAGEIGYSKEEQLGSYLSPKLIYGAWVKASKAWKVLVQAKLFKRYGGVVTLDHQYDGGINYSIGSRNEIRLKLKRTDHRRELSLGVNHYF